MLLGVLVLPGTSGAAVQEPEDTDAPAEAEAVARPVTPPAASPDAEPEWTMRFGATVVAGAPEGLGAALLVQPRPWLRVRVGGARNSLGSGVRAGVDLLPMRRSIAPVLALEYGHTFRADYEQLLSRLHGQPTTAVTGIRQVDYDWVGASVGLEYAPWSRLTLFATAGISYWFIGVRDVDAFIREGESPLLTSTPLLLNISAPVARLGLIFYFN